MRKDNKSERVKRFAQIWSLSRADTGKTQEYMANGLGVSKKTIQNWEKGASAPDLFEGSEWFRVRRELWQWAVNICSREYQGLPWRPAMR